MAKNEMISKAAPDKERAKALLKMVALRAKDIKTKNNEFAPLIIEGYYEQVKELITAIMAIDGYKTLSHELLIEYIATHYKQFSYSEISLMDHLRKTRNDIAYRGIMVPPDYIPRNKQEVLVIISKLKQIILNKLTGQDENS